MSLGHSPQEPQPKAATTRMLETTQPESAAPQPDLRRRLAAIITAEITENPRLTTDRVTGLANLRGLEAVARRLLPICRRVAVPVSVVLFRIDMDFGLRLDAGRAKAFAAILGSSFRQSDVTARITDDIFALLLSGAAVADAEAVRQRLDSMLDDHNRLQLGGSELRLEYARVDYSADRHCSVLELIDDAHWQLFEAGAARASI